jgi:O-antigen/teichoic acid export membrane protein
MSREHGADGSKGRAARPDPPRRSGVQDTAAALSSRVASFAISLGIQASLAWFLGPAGRGSYAVCLLFANLLGLGFRFATDLAGRYAVASGRMTKPEAVWSTASALLVASGLAIVAGRLLMETDLPIFAKASRSSFLVALAVIPFTVLGQGCVSMLVGLGRISWMAVMMAAAFLAQLLAVLVLVRGFDLGVEGALAAVTAAGSTRIVFTVIALRQEGAFARVRLRLAHYRLLVSYGLRAYVHRVGNTINVRVGTMVLAFFATPAEIGIFAASSGLMTQLLLLPNSVSNTLFSRVAADERGKPEVVSQAARITGMVAGAGLVLLCALARPIVALLLSPRFLAGVPLIWIMAPGVFLRATWKILIPFYMGTNRPGVCSWAVGAGIVVNVGSLLLLLPAIGLAGAAWAMTLGFLTSSIVLVAAFRRVTGMGLAETWFPRAGDVARIGRAIADLRSQGVGPRVGRRSPRASIPGRR